MERLYIKQEKYTPEIDFNESLGILNIKGNSYPENTLNFYEPILNWIEEYLKLNKYNKIIVNFEITYFNSSSSKVFFEIFDMFDEIKEKRNIEINWIYDKDNESILEVGEDYKLDFDGLNFNLLER